MKTIIGCCILFTMLIQLQAQENYTITFAAEDINTTIDSIIVTNLTQDTSITIKNGLSVTLYNSSTSTHTLIDRNNWVNVYPNPVVNSSTLDITNPSTGNVVIQLTDNSGKIIFTKKEFLEKGNHSFKLNGIPRGIYTLGVTTIGNTTNKKIISYNPNRSKFEIQYNGKLQEPNASKLKATNQDGTSGMIPFTTGDYMRYQGYSSTGEYWVADSTGSNAHIIFYFTPCTDIDNNKYPVIRIGQQYWIARNLRATRYANGAPIWSVSNSTEWYNLTESGKGYCWYNNDSISYAKTYGALYTWAAATRGSDGSNLNPSGVQGVCPTGWHLPSDAEWVVLINNLGGPSKAGGKLKETGYRHWLTPNIEATNRTGFTALPGGYRSYKGSFYNMGAYGTWWTATIYWWEAMNNYYGGVDRDNHDFSLGTGFSVRCVKD
jgi:uncharacterized protein (TIGR02145 family)